MKKKKIFFLFFLALEDGFTYIDFDRLMGWVLLVSLSELYSANLPSTVIEGCYQQPLRKIGG